MDGGGREFLFDGGRFDGWGGDFYSIGGGVIRPCFSNLKVSQHSDPEHTSLINCGFKQFLDLK